MKATPGQMVTAARDAAGSSQAGLARVMGVQAQAVSRLEHDVHSPTVRTLEKVAEALGLELRIEFARPGRGSTQWQRSYARALEDLADSNGRAADAPGG